MKPEKEETMQKDSFEDRITHHRLQNNPLLVQLRTFAASLKEEGYSDVTMLSKVLLLADFGQWLRRSQRTLEHLDEQLVGRFINHEHAVRRGDLKTFQQFLEHLRSRDVIPARPCFSDKSPLADVLRRYQEHLRSERGLVTTTIVGYKTFIHKFLLERFGKGPLLFAELRASDISDFILRHAPTMSPRRAQLMTTAFRSFFRFLFRNGELETDLAACVPTVADWRLSTVPKYLSPEEVGRVIAACDRRTSTGRRDYAILLLLARLGLRAGEVVALQLDDLDWRAGEIIVRGKGLFHDRMPLPCDVGEALTSYLRRDRPHSRTRRVFVCMKAPRRGFAGPSTLTTIVRRALDRADLHPVLKGAHLLRHSLATSMLRSGMTMNEIGEVLRHRIPSTTEIYAKVDFHTLRALAHPWPIGGGQ